MPGTEVMSDGEKDESMFAFNPDARVNSARVGECPIAVTVADNVLLRPQQLAEFGQVLHSAKTTAIYIPVCALECRQNSLDLFTHGSPVRFTPQACWKKAPTYMMMPASFPSLTKAAPIYCLYNESRTMILAIQRCSRPSSIFSIAPIPELRFIGIERPATKESGPIMQAITGLP